MKKKIFRLIFVLVLVVASIVGLRINVDANSNLVLGTTISDNPDDRLFTVRNNSSNNVAYIYQASDNPSQSIEMTIGGNQTQTIRVKAGSNGTASLTVKQLDLAGAVSQVVNSLNQYYVKVNFVDSNHQVIASSRQAIATYSSGCSYTAPATLTYNGETYDLSGNNYAAIPYGSREYTFTYNVRAQLDFTSKVILVDQDGITHKTIEYTVSKANGGQTTVPETFVSSINGRTYKIMSGYNRQVSQSYDQGVLQTVIRYQVQDNETSQPYNISIQYIDQATGSVLLTKTLLVENGKTVIHDPSSAFMKNGKQYQLVSGSSITHSFAQGKQVYQVYYQAVVTDETTPQPIQVNYIDLATGNILQIHEYTVEPGKTKTISLDSSFDYDGTTYILNGTQRDEIDGTKIIHKFGSDVTEYNVYYTEKGVEVNQYEVSVTYLDVSHTNIGEETIYTTKLNASINQPLAIDFPTQYEANGTTYVLLSGQKSHFDHDFYSTRRNYVMVYRDINDTNNDIVLNPVVVETTTTPTTTLEGTTANGTAITIDGATGTPVMTNPDGAITTVDQDGNIVPYQEAETEIIEEEETPLAGNVADKVSKDQTNNQLTYVALSVAGLIVIGAIVVYIVRKKKTKQA